MPAGFRAEGGRLYLAADYGDGTGTNDRARAELFEAVKADA